MDNKILKLGFIINNCGPNQLAYQLINSANSYLANTDDADISIFYHNITPLVVKPNFGIFGLFEGFGYAGTMIATSIQSASRMMTWPGPNRNRMYYYLMDLDWLRLQQRNWAELAGVYLNDKISLIARSKSHADIITTCWKPPVGIVEDCDFSGFVNLVKSECNEHA